MSRLLLAALVLTSPAAPGQPPKPAPTKPTITKPTPAKPAPPPAVPDEARVTATGPVTVGSPPPVDPAAPPPAGPVSPVVLTKYGLTLLVVAGTDAEKTSLVTHVPIGTALDFQRKYVAAGGWADGRSPVFALVGRLTTEDEPNLFTAGAAPILTDGPAFRLAEKRRLVLVVETATEVTRFNKDRFPAGGYVSVEGRPADAKTDLKLMDVEGLAVRNVPVPVVVAGRKPPPAAQVRATGVLATADGRVELRDAVVKVTKK